MANADNDDFLGRRFIEDSNMGKVVSQSGVSRFAGELAAVGILHQKSGDRLYVRQNLTRTPW